MVGIKYIKNGVEGRKIHRVKQIIGFSRGLGILDSGNGFNELLAFVLPFALIDRAGAEECNKVFFKAVEMRVEHLFIGIGADAHFFVSYNACQLVDTAVFGKEGVEGQMSNYEEERERSRFSPRVSSDNSEFLQARFNAKKKTPQRGVFFWRREEDLNLR